MYVVPNLRTLYLRSLFSFFTSNLSAKCCCFGKLLDIYSLSFTRQGHAVSVNIFCLCGDSIKWLSSPIMRGTIPKHYVNMRYGDIVCFTVFKRRVCFALKWVSSWLQLWLTFKLMVSVVEWFMGFCPVGWQKRSIPMSAKQQILVLKLTKRLTHIDYYILRARYRFYSRVFNTILRTSEWAIWY